MTKILITGGTGTFGNAFTQYALAHNLYKRIIILSRDEDKQQTMRNRFSDERLRFFLGDVRDQACLFRAFDGVDAIIHAAALKHVDRSGESFDQFHATNTIGSSNVINAAILAGVSKAVFLSSDKACEPSTPYGTTKRAMEWFAVGGNAWGHSRFCCTRYGNVLDSRGSVLGLWQARVDAGLPLQITDPSMTRFWMTIQDAVDLALLALKRMRGGEIFIPKNVNRSSVGELALKHHPGWPVKITGKRSYEKQHELLVSGEEMDRLRDCGDVYVLLPEHVRWEPRPYGESAPGVGAGFEYGSDK